MKSPCTMCYLRDKDKTGPACTKCEARSLYAEYTACDNPLTCADINRIEREIIAAIPTKEQIHQIFSDTLTRRPDITPGPELKQEYTGPRPRVKLRTFRAFYRAARREGYKDIKDWFNNDYIKHRKSGKYMRDKVVCAQVTLCKMLRIYGAPHPAEHYTHKVLADLDSKRVLMMLNSGYTMQAVANDQGCSTGLIDRFRRIHGLQKKARLRIG